MDWSALSCPALGWDLCAGILSVIVINLVLSGDNAVVIAMAVNLLPKEKRFLGLLFGIGVGGYLAYCLDYFCGAVVQYSRYQTYRRGPDLLDCSQAFD